MYASCLYCVPCICVFTVVCLLRACLCVCVYVQAALMKGYKPVTVRAVLEVNVFRSLLYCWWHACMLLCFINYVFVCVCVFVFILISMYYVCSIHILHIHVGGWVFYAHAVLMRANKPVKSVLCW